jgi:hypothetical protein
MSKTWVARFVTVVFSLQIGAHAQTAPSLPATAIRRIEITSSLSELGRQRTIHTESSRPSGSEPDTSDFVIHKEGDAYYLNDKIVDSGLIVALQQALTAPAISSLSIDDLGITPAWLKAHAASVAQHLAKNWINGVPVHAAALESAFADPEIMDKVVPTLFDVPHYSCKDCIHPVLSVKVSVDFEDGTSLEARSSSQFPFMLPWHVRRSGEETTTYSADISRAAAALMPERSTNRSRLSGENLDLSLGRVVMMQVEREAQLRDVETQTGGTLSAIRSRYTVEYAKIDNYGEFRSRGAGTADSNLRLRLKATSLPSNFSEDVALAYVNGSVVGADKFLRHCPGFEKLALSVPWLNQYAQSHPRVPIELSYFHDASFTDGELSRFSADMRAIGRKKLIPKVEAMKDQVVLLHVGLWLSQSDWLVFPDQHMLLWRVRQFPRDQSASGLPAWSTSEYSEKPCAETSNLLLCVGREASPSGTLQPLD